MDRRGVYGKVLKKQAMRVLVCIPSDTLEPVSTIYTKIVSLAKEYKLGRMPREDEVADWHGQEWEFYLENLPKGIEASQDLGEGSCYANFLGRSTNRPLQHSSIPVLKFSQRVEIFASIAMYKFVEEYVRFCILTMSFKHLLDH